jgi:hypothetical protein
MASARQAANDEVTDDHDEDDGENAHGILLIEKPAGYSHGLVAPHSRQYWPDMRDMLLAHHSWRHVLCALVLVAVVTP